jgi:hypothetical protein
MMKKGREKFCGLVGNDHFFEISPFVSSVAQKVPYLETLALSTVALDECPEKSTDR